MITTHPVDNPSGSRIVEGKHVMLIRIYTVEGVVQQNCSVDDLVVQSAVLI